MDEDLVKRLSIPYTRLDEINQVLLDSNTEIIQNFLAVVDKYGTPEEINQKANLAGSIRLEKPIRNISGIWNG
jgi:hypothetical protein